MYNKKRKLERAHQLADEKRQALKRLGYDVSNISDYKLRKVKLSDIKNVSRETLNRQIPKRKRKSKPLTFEQKQRKSQSAKRLHKKKQDKLLFLGIEPEFLSTTNLRKVKISDIENGNISKSNYPFLFEKTANSHFNFDKRYYFPNGKGWYLAWLDYSGESTLEESLYRFMKFSNNTLIDMLKAILKQPPTYSKDKDMGSSGRAGDFRSFVTDNENATFMKNSDNSKIDENRAKKRYHTGINRYWQTVGSDGKNIITSVTGRECLILLNAIFYNVIEDVRVNYQSVYDELVYYIKEFKKFLPKPSEFYFGKDK